MFVVPMLFPKIGRLLTSGSWLELSFPRVEIGPGSTATMRLIRSMTLKVMLVTRPCWITRDVCDWGE